MDFKPWKEVWAKDTYSGIKRTKVKDDWWLGENDPRTIYGVQRENEDWNLKEQLIERVKYKSSWRNLTRNSNRCIPEIRIQWPSLRPRGKRSLMVSTWWFCHLVYTNSSGRTDATMAPPLPLPSCFHVKKLLLKYLAWLSFFPPEKSDSSEKWVGRRSLLISSLTFHSLPQQRPCLCEGD